MEQLRVEFYGIPRQRTGVAEAIVAVPKAGECLGQVLADLGQRFPELARECMSSGQLQPPFIACLDGERFLRDSTELVMPGQALMILSADAGG